MSGRVATSMFLRVGIPSGFSTVLQSAESCSQLAETEEAKFSTAFAAEKANLARSREECGIQRRLGLLAKAVAPA